MKSKLKILFAFICFILMFNVITFADEDSEEVCTHECTYEIYSLAEDDSQYDIYHGLYCPSCGKLMSLSAHQISYTDIDSGYHMKSCSKCGYQKTQQHTASAVKINIGETVNGKTYNSDEDLDEKHKIICLSCNHFFGTADHTWAGGDTLKKKHYCKWCNQVYSSYPEATSRTTLF